METIREAIINNSLTKTERMVADFILDNQAEACFMTSTEVAGRLHISDASVIRFSRTLGFAGYMDFRKTLQEEYRSKVTTISSAVSVPSERLAKSLAKSPVMDYIEEYWLNTNKNLESVIINNDKKAFDAAADILIKSKRKFIVASRANLGSSLYLNLLLKHMLSDVYSANGNGLSVIDHLADAGADDCIIAISFPRYSEMDRAALQMASEAGSSIIVITDRGSSLLAPYATVLFTVNVDSSMFFNSYVAVEFLLELLCTRIGRLLGDKPAQKLDHIDQYLDQLKLY